MRRHNSVPGIALISLAALAAGTQGWADDPPMDGGGRRARSGRSAERLQVPTTFPGPNSPGAVEEVHQAIILDARGEKPAARGRFMQALSKERYVNRMGRELSIRGEGAFAPWILDSRWRTRDACLTYLTDRRAQLALYERVWETKGDGTRLLERTYAALHAMHVTGRSRAYRFTPGPGAAAENRSKLDSEIRARMEIRREIVRLLLEPTRDPADRDRRLGELFERKDGLMRDDIDTLSRTQPPDGLKQVHQASPQFLHHILERDCAFVDFLRYGRLEYDLARPGFEGERYVPSYLAFVMRSSGPSLSEGLARVDLGPCGPIDAAVDRWRHAIDRGDEATAEAAEVGRLVWDKVAKELPPGTATVYLSPDGQLGTVPWGALPGRRPGTVLLEDYALAQVPDGYFLLHHLLLSRTPGEYEALRRRVGHLRPPGYGPVGSMSLNDALELSIAPRRPLDGGAPALAVGGIHADLPGSAREVERIRKLAGGRPFVALAGAEATPERLMEELPRACYVHIATHGFFAEDALIAEQRQVAEQGKATPHTPPTVGLGSRYPLAYTGLLLAGPTPASGVAERVLTSETIPEINLGLRTRLCVLSACRTGLGDPTSGEGAQGLVRAFHLAGCDDVVASLWNVNDAATETLMEEFYRRLWQDRKAPIESLRQAQLELYRHPERVAGLPDDRKAPIDPAVTAPVNPSRSDKEVEKAGPAPRRTPPRWWAAFVLSGVGR